MTTLPSRDACRNAYIGQLLVRMVLDGPFFQPVSVPKKEHVHRATVNSHGLGWLFFQPASVPKHALHRENKCLDHRANVAKPVQGALDQP